MQPWLAISAAVDAVRVQPLLLWMFKHVLRAYTDSLFLMPAQNENFKLNCATITVPGLTQEEREYLITRQEKRKTDIEVIDVCVTMT